MYNKYYPYLYNRSNPHFSHPPPPPHHPPKPIPKPPKPPRPPKKKLDFNCLKKDTCKSLNDVEYFLNNFSHTLKYIRLINLLK